MKNVLNIIKKIFTIKKDLVITSVEEKRKEYQKNYYQKNRDKKIEYSKKYYELNRDKIKVKSIKYKDKRKEYLKNYYQKNRDKIIEYQLKYLNDKRVLNIKSRV